MVVAQVKTFSNILSDMKDTKCQSKRRREAINGELAILRSWLPVGDPGRSRLSQLQILSLACIYIRKSNYFHKLFPAITSTTEKAPSDNKTNVTSNGKATATAAQAETDTTESKNFDDPQQSRPPTRSPTATDFAQSLPGFFIVATQLGKMLYISENVAQYVGHSAYELMSQGDSIYDLVDVKDHHDIKSGFEKICGKYSSAAAGGGESLSFFCRLVSTHARRTSGPPSFKSTYLVRGKFILPTSCDKYTKQPVFVGLCCPVSTPSVRNSLLLNDTTTFQTTHAVDMKITAVDNSGKILLGYSIDELRNKSWYELVHPLDTCLAADHHRLLLNAAAHQDAGSSLIVRLLTKSEDYVWVNVAMRRKSTSNGHHNNRGTTGSTANKEVTFICINQIITESEALSLQEKQAVSPLQAGQSVGGLSVAPDPLGVALRLASAQMPCRPHLPSSVSIPESYQPLPHFYSHNQTQVTATRPFSYPLDPEQQDQQHLLYLPELGPELASQVYHISTEEQHQRHHEPMQLPYQTPAHSIQPQPDEHQQTPFKLRRISSTDTTTDMSYTSSLSGGGQEFSPIPLSSSLTHSPFSSSNSSYHNQKQSPPIGSKRTYDWVAASSGINPSLSCSPENFLADTLDDSVFPLMNYAPTTTVPPPAFAFSPQPRYASERVVNNTVPPASPPPTTYMPVPPVYDYFTTTTTHNNAPFAYTIGSGSAHVSTGIYSESILDSGATVHESGALVDFPVTGPTTGSAAELFRSSLTSSCTSSSTDSSLISDVDIICPGAGATGREVHLPSDGNSPNLDFADLQIASAGPTAGSATERFDFKTRVFQSHGLEPPRLLRTDSQRTQHHPPQLLPQPPPHHTSLPELDLEIIEEFFEEIKTPVPPPPQKQALGRTRSNSDSRVNYDIFSHAFKFGNNNNGSSQEVETGEEVAAFESRLDSATDDLTWSGLFPSLLDQQF